MVTSPPYFGLRDYGMTGQIGLEETPDAYVAALVAVFREVRRVLRKDGTLWLNLGDSYAGSWGAQLRGGPPSASSTLTGNGHIGGGPKLKSLSSIQIAAYPKTTLTGSINKTPGLKPKDLIGIPWRVARALQEPFYTGRIKDVRDRIWLAAIIDGEGCMFIHKRKAGTDSGSKFTRADGTEVSYARTQDTYGSGLEVANTSEAIVERCRELTGIGSICRQDKDRRQPLYRWNVRSNECRWIVQEVYPHLIGKPHQARLMLGCPSSGERAEAAHAGLIALHNGSSTDVDFPAPPSLFEHGWYLRQDIIWAKSNPMPESVRDRCTKAHEMIFLLTKNERYFYDAGAIAERFANGIEAAVPWKANGGVRNVGGRSDGFSRGTAPEWRPNQDGRNRRSVWTITTQPFPEAHFATFPPELPELCIKAGCPVGGTVLDPFAGAGTTGLVADRLGRDAILIELNPAYGGMAHQRIVNDGPLFAAVALRSG